MDMQRCGRCMHYRSTGGGMCIVYGSRVSADDHHVTDRSAITGEDYGCENFYTPEADEEWCRPLERAERRPCRGGDRLMAAGVMHPETPALDVACGPRSFYFDKADERVTFCDLHPRHVVLCDGRALDVEPDVVADFRDLPFPDGSFSLVIFDPPHLDVGAGWQVDKYGKLDPKHWKGDLSAGFRECLRVLKPSGVLVFKWYEYHTKLSDVLSCCPVKPVLGNRRPRSSKTHWVLFMKEE